MKYMTAAFRTQNFYLCLCCIALLIEGCKHKEGIDRRINQMDSAKAAGLARSIESLVRPELADSLTLRLWGIDSLVISPVAIDIDDSGNYIMPQLTGKEILNLIFAVTRIGRLHQYNYKLLKIKKPFFIKYCRRKTARRMDG